jgi:hypothetical protein
MLWGFEALRIFDDKLKKALNETAEAQTRIRSFLTRGSDSRHRDMVRMAETVTEDLDKRYNRLNNAHSSILQRIEQGTKPREGITSVLGVEQNENISRLTWLTIIYLPPAFVAAIFNRTIVPVEWEWLFGFCCRCWFLPWCFRFRCRRLLIGYGSIGSCFVSRVWVPCLGVGQREKTKGMPEKKQERVSVTAREAGEGHGADVRRRRAWLV